MEKLIEVAAGAVIGTLTKAAVEPALAAGGKVWAWLKGRAGAHEATNVAAVEADPARPSSLTRVTGLLQDVLHDDPEAAEELRRLLDVPGGMQAVRQSSNIVGDKNTNTQIVGSGNRVGKG